MAVGTRIRQNRIHMIRNNVFLRNRIGVVIACVSFRMNELDDDE